MNNQSSWIFSDQSIYAQKNWALVWSVVFSSRHADQECMNLEIHRYYTSIVQGSNGNVFRLLGRATYYSNSYNVLSMVALQNRKTSVIIPCIPLHLSRPRLKLLR